METVGLTLTDLETQEAQLIHRRDAYIEEANRNIAGFNGAVQQVQIQKALLIERQKQSELSSVSLEAEVSEDME
jgi:hypothetical protein